VNVSNSKAGEVEQQVGRGITHALGQRFLRPQTLLSFLFAALIIVFLVRRVDVNPVQLWQEIRSANLALVGIALLIFYSGFLIRVIRWRQMLTQAGITSLPNVTLPTNAGMLEIMLLSWFANCIVPAKLGDVYRAVLLKRRSNAPITTTMGTIAAERIIDLLLLLVLMLATAPVVYGSNVPNGSPNAMVYGGACAMAIIVAVGLVWVFWHRLRRQLPAILGEPIARVQFGLFENLRSPWPCVGYSALLWILEGVRFFFIAWSLGTVLPPSTALFIALAGSLAAVWPFTPAGLGVVEATLVYLLTLAGVSADTAAAIVLLERVVSYWSLIVVGIPLYIKQMRGEVRETVKQAPTA
jgi:uncharacterized membrane protein YbhN (UPF0104 family)